jgi:AT-binding transcription factor 1
MSGLQIKMMKAVFEVYKTPTMTECSNLGKDIGLQKRVVQVWFQNARAKEKRAKLQLQQATGGRDGDIGANFQPPTPERCVVCPDFSYVEGKGCAVQDHIFTRNHLENLKMALEQGRYEPEAPGTILSQAAVAISGGNNGVLSSTSSPPPTLSANIPPSTRDNNALQMLQMATQSATKATSNNTSSLTSELMEMSSMQNGRMLMQV